jgi:hypothetical protein
MHTLHHLDTITSNQTTKQKTVPPVIQRRFCPSIFCFTDELVVQRVSQKADVWLLSDEHEERSWLMIGEKPVCPHCGTTLL